jgi:hypothetical protein
MIRYANTLQTKIMPSLEVSRDCANPINVSNANVFESSIFLSNDIFGFKEFEKGSHLIHRDSSQMRTFNDSDLSCSTRTLIDSK